MVSEPRNTFLISICVFNSISLWLWKLFSHVQFVATLEFSRPEYWNGYPFPSPGDLPNPGIDPKSPTLQADSLLSEPLGKTRNTGVGSLSLLQWIFLTQKSSQGLLHCRQILYQLSYQLSLMILMITKIVHEQNLQIKKGREKIKDQTHPFTTPPRDTNHIWISIGTIPLYELISCVIVLTTHYSISPSQKCKSVIVLVNISCLVIL